MKESSLRLYVSGAAPKPDGALHLHLPRPGEQKPEPSLALVENPSEEIPFKRSIQSIALEDAIITALDASANPNERASEAFRRKEHAIGQLFGALSIVDAHILYRRLSVRDAADPIATRFARLIVERQARLMNFLGDARRRAALARSR